MNPLEQSRITGNLARISQGSPVLTEDKFCPPRTIEALATRIPNAKLVKIEGGSHNILVEMRGRFNKEVLDFLRDS